MTEAEIKAKYKARHDTLSESYYAGTSGLSKEEFDQQHGKIWDDMRKELISYGYITPPKPRPHFEKSPPGLALGEKLKRVEEFLAKVHPKES